MNAEQATHTDDGQFSTTETRPASSGPPDLSLSTGWQGVYAALDVPLPTDEPDPILPAKRRERRRASEQDAARRGVDARQGTAASGNGDRRGEVFGL
jgi:hypothetical protein